MASIKATARTAAGSRKVQVLRKEGKIPGIIYGHGQTPEPITLDKKEVENVVHHGERLLEVLLDGRTENALVKEVQYDAYGSEILHLDLARVNLDEMVEITVPITLRGTPVGAAEGGVLQQIAADVTIECMVRHIPDDIRVNVAEMKLGDKLTMKDLQLPEGAKLSVDGELLVATVSMITEKEEVPVEEAVATPEVIGAKKEEEGAGEEAAEKK